MKTNIRTGKYNDVLPVGSKVVIHCQDPETNAPDTVVSRMVRTPDTVDEEARYTVGNTIYAIKREDSETCSLNWQYPRFQQYIENQDRWSRSIQSFLDILCPGAKIVQTAEGVPSLYELTFDEGSAMAILNTLMFLDFLQDCKTKGINITEGRNLTKHWRGYLRNLLDKHPITYPPHWNPQGKPPNVRGFIGSSVLPLLIVAR